MSDSLFDDESIPFIILANPIGQYSLWPDPLPRPRGWSQVYGPMPRQQCMQWLSSHWSALLPPPQQPREQSTT